VYGLHPSEELVALFREAPFQGQHPCKAKVIFFGVDANYSESLWGHPFFRWIKVYQQNGIAFWEAQGKHHPFLLDEYPFKKNTGGVPYHRNFSALKLPKEYAKYISFVELLDVPTMGNSSNEDKIFWSLFNPDHAAWLDSIVADGSGRLVFLSDGVIRKMREIKRKWGIFDWIPRSDEQGLLCEIGSTQVHKVFHFSDGRIYKQIPGMRELICNFCRNCCSPSL
jgi:hypothetical protein